MTLISVTLPGPTEHPVVGAQYRVTSSSGSDPSNAFDGNGSTAWTSAATYTPNAGNIMKYAGGTAPVSAGWQGEWLQVDLPVAGRLVSYDFASGSLSKDGQVGRFVVLGSNDGGQSFPWNAQAFIVTSGSQYAWMRTTLQNQPSSAYQTYRLVVRGVLHSDPNLPAYVAFLPTLTLTLETDPISPQWPLSVSTLPVSTLSLKLVGVSPLQLAYASDARQDHVLVLSDSVTQRESFDARSKCPSSVLGVVFKGAITWTTCANQNRAVQVLPLGPGQPLPLRLVWASDRAPVTLASPATLFLESGE